MCRESDHMWQALIRGESNGLVMKGGLRSGHANGEIKVYGPYHLVSCLAVKIQCLYRYVGGDSAYEQGLNISACVKRFLSNAAVLILDEQTWLSFHSVR